MNYLAAWRIFQLATCKIKGKRLEWKTRLFDRGKYFAVRYHKTDVVGIYNDGSYVLNSGGWRSKITLKRMNTYVTGWNIYQAKKTWYVVNFTNQCTYLYHDGIRLGTFAADGVEVHSK